MNKRRLNSTQIIMLSFLGLIALGSALLSLPCSAADGVRIPYIDALFTATTATCVTGLVTLPVHSSWSFFGQVVILLLIQIGGLGVITILSGLMISLHKKLGIRDRMLLQDAFNLNTLSGILRFTRRVILGSFLIEAVGALLYMTVFIPEMGLRGVWVSLFTAVSAFCNAGIDIIGDTSLYAYVTDPMVSLVTCGLIVLGGIGFIVWWDVLRVLAPGRQTRRPLRRLTLHSKIALSVTAALILLGAGLFLLLEYHNADTLAPLTLPQKCMAALFQSVTCRTAGFATIAQEDLSNGSAVLSLLLMFIGGSPIGTAGGVKTVTFAVLIAAMVSTVRGRDEVVLFHRNISRDTVSKASAVVCMSFLILFLSTLVLAAVTEADALDILYETTSATATVGLTRALTPTLELPGKLVILVTMFLGRVGPISLAIAFNTGRKNINVIKNPTETISVG
ncbi:MAG: potassium transporter KtrB [Oscillospiraceae bacterium]|nr:potassium transporter KtrB [Oscillospiraceae bacterium]